MAAPESERPLAALLGRGAAFEGDLSFDGRVRLDGTFTGRMKASDTLEIGPHGQVEGEIEAATLRISGTVRGRVVATTLLVLDEGGVIHGEVEAAAMEMHPGARLDATVKAGEPR
ncbi:MAG: polymer-forming cytoskeletal protein [Alphaproteobacteria bacterium]|nr:polymer-forming cytoskeletal protein [Alphaproteobacteria bacterium]